MATKRKPLNPPVVEDPTPFKICRMDGCGSRARKWLRIDRKTNVPLCCSCFASYPKELATPSR